MSEFSVRPDWMAFCLPDISEAEVQADADVIRSGWWAKGPRTMEFQKKFAEYVGAKHCIAVNSCTAALHLALLTQGIGPGDEVITTPLTFASTANTILHVGATPVFADIDPDTGLIDPAEIEKKVTNRTRAVVPVHYSGLAADLGAIGQICDAHNLFLSEDAAHAVETRYNGELIGHHPRGTVSYSFYATKNLACGEGGALVTELKTVITGGNAGDGRRRNRRQGAGALLPRHERGRVEPLRQGRLLALRHRGAGLQIQHVRHSGRAGADPAWPHVGYAAPPL